MKSQQSGFAHAFLIIGLVIALIGALGFIFWQQFVNDDSKKDVESSKNDTSAKQKVEKTEIEAPKTGTISGRAIYPSEVFPEDFKVCAEKESDRRYVTCDTGIVAGVYEIPLSPGNYYVVARSGNLEGYYDGYMKSGMTNNICDPSNHTPLVVSVVAGVDLKNIDAGDFYYAPENC